MHCDLSKSDLDEALPHAGWLDIAISTGHNGQVKKKRKSLAALQSELAAQFPWVLQGVSRPAPETTSTGWAVVDALTCGLPRGSLVEVYGERCSGRTSLMVKMLATAIGRGETCVLVDASDAFDPESGQAAGVDLERLLWVRCARFDQAFRVAEWLLLGGGIGLLVLDLSQILPTELQHVPPSVWFRLRRAVEHTSTVLVVLEQRPFAGPSASLVLEVRAEGSRWSRTQNAPAPAHANLFSEKCISTEVVRSRGGENSGNRLLTWRERVGSRRCSIRLRCSK
jgi:hypothetical protein